MSIYSDKFKAALLIEEQETKPNYTIDNISDALCGDRVEAFIRAKGAEILLEELKAKQGN